MKRLLVLLLAACGSHPAPTSLRDACRPVALNAELAWYGHNRVDLEAQLDSRGCASPGFDPRARPLALFDWDDTIAKNDAGDAFTAWLIAHAKVRQPPGQDWTQTSRFLTAAAAAALAAACGTTVAAGQPLPTDVNHACADEMWSIYLDEVTTGHQPAWMATTPRHNKPSYAWAPQLFAGYTHEEVQAFVRSMLEEQLAAPAGSTMTVGTHEVDGWLRIYDQQASLLAAARSRGYDVWIITASAQDVISVFAQRVDIPADHVIGIRSIVDAAGKLTTHLEGCGPSGDGEDGIIPYLEGKRCFINKVIFGDRTAAALDRRVDRSREVLAGGDSDSDVEFLRDATYKWVLNRNKPALMCRAYANDHDSWRINPMFLGPKPVNRLPYPCSTTACVDASGAKVPCLDDAGKVLPDQADTIHAR